MIVARTLNDVPLNTNSVVTVGTFDGVHQGHRSIIRHLTSRARTLKARSVIVTFDPHPREIVGRGPVKGLSSLQERLKLIGGLEVDVTLVLEFTYEFSRQRSRDFYERYLVNGTGVREVIVGHDHMFGRDREAGIRELQIMGSELGFTLDIVEPVSIDGEIVSSSRIRELLLRGEVERAERFLGRRYTLEGVVVTGDRRGTQLGFPTANMMPADKNKLVPAEGVYFVVTEFEGHQHFGMLNIGTRPTFHAALQQVVEVHIFDFSQTIYGKDLNIQFVKRLRPEKKFASREDLVTQLHHDRDECMKYMTHYNQ